MRLDKSDPDIKHVSLTPARGQDFCRSFLALVEAIEPNFQSRLVERTATLFKTKTVSGIFMVRNSLILQLNNSLLQVVHNKSDLGSSNIAHFFCFYFVEAYEEASTGSRAILVGRLRSSLNQEMELPALFFELAVARTFRRRGHKVEFVEPALNARGPDLMVSTKYNDLSVECKCISSDSKFPISEALLQKLLDLLTQTLKAMEKNGTGIHLEATFQGTRGNAVFRNAVEEAKHLLKEIETGTSFAAGKVWSFRLKSMPEDFCAGDESRVFTDSEYKLPHVLENCAAVLSVDASLLTVQVKHPWRIDEAAESVIKSAFGQIPTQGYRLIWIQLLGSLVWLNPYRHIEHLREIAMQIMNNGDTARRHQKQCNAVNGYIGINVSGDFYTQPNEAGVIGIDYYTVLSESNEEAAISTYQFDFLRKLPSQLKKSTP